MLSTSSRVRFRVGITAPVSPRRSRTSRMFPDSTGCGPTSRKTRWPSSIRAPMASANRTERRTLLAQYRGPQPSESPVTRVPVTVE